jgi:hypothetical protein
MTQEEKRIKLAEAGGWINCKVQRHPNHNKMDNMEPDKLLFGINPKKTGVWKVPDYFNDLNAVHEFIVAQSCEFLIRYRNTLADFCGSQHYHNATAAQRAEAIGLTLELWKATK